MRLVFVAPRFHTNQHPLVKALVGQGHEVRFHVLRSSHTENHTYVTPEVVVTSKWLDSMLDTIAKRGRHFDRTNYASPTLGAYFAKLREWRPDAIVVRNPQHIFSLVSLVAARLLNVRPILYTQGPVYASTSSRVKLLRSIVSRLTGGQWMSPVLGDVAGAPRAHPRMHYVPFASDGEAESKQTWFEGDRVNVLGIGKFFRRKNHMLLLRAIARLRAETSLSLTLVGEVTLESHRQHLAEVEAFVRDNGLEDIVTIRTNLEHSEMAAVYLAHDVFVLASRSEPASVAVLEAMTHGLAVVCSTTNGTRHDITDGVNGYVFESDDEDDLVAKLRLIVTDRGLLKAMGAESRRVSTGDHDPELVAAKLLELASR